MAVAADRLVETGRPFSSEAGKKPHMPSVADPEALRFWLETRHPPKLSADFGSDRAVDFILQVVDNALSHGRGRRYVRSQIYHIVSNGVTRRDNGFVLGSSLAE